MIAGKNTVFSVDNRGDEITFRVGICHAMSVYYTLCGSGEVTPYHIEIILNFHHFIEGDGGSRISFYAATTLTFSEVAAETFGNDVE